MHIQPTVHIQIKSPVPELIFVVVLIIKLRMSLSFIFKPCAWYFLNYVK